MGKGDRRRQGKHIDYVRGFELAFGPKPCPATISIEMGSAASACIEAHECKHKYCDIRFYGKLPPYVDGSHQC